MIAINTLRWIAWIILLVAGYLVAISSLLPGATLFVAGVCMIWAVELRNDNDQMV